MATECWDLHRSLLEENGNSNYIQDKLLSYKKGVLKLELDLNICNKKRFDLVKELSTAATQIENGDKKCTELAEKIVQLSSSQVSYKRTITKLTSKITTMELEKLAEWRKKLASL